MKNIINKIKSIKTKFTGLPKKKKIIISTVSGLLLITTIGTFMYARNTYGFTMTEKQKDSKIEEVLKGKDYSKASQINQRYYSSNSAKKDIYDKTINLCKETNTSSLEEAGDYIAQEQKNMPKIIDIDLKPTYSFSYDYVDVKLTVKNEGNKDIKYIRINIYFLDKNNKIVHSEWTNSDDIILQGSTQVVTKMVKWDTNWKDIKYEVSDWSFR